MSKNSKEESELTDLVSTNQNLKDQIIYILENIDTIDIEELEKKIVPMLKNMMNFFAQYVEEIPAFDSLTVEQQEILIKRFKKSAHSLIQQKIHSIDEMMQVFVFTVLNNINQENRLTAQAKYKEAFRESLKKAVDDKITPISTSSPIKSKSLNHTTLQTNKTKEFLIHSAIKLNVEEAIKNIKLDIDITHTDKASLKTSHKKDKVISSPFIT